MVSRRQSDPKKETNQCLVTKGKKGTIKTEDSTYCVSVYFSLFIYFFFFVNFLHFYNSRISSNTH